MAHPTHEEWMSYLYGELDAATQRTLTAHLRSCADCEGRVSEWRSAMFELEAWRLPEKRSASRARQRVVGWGIAASLILAMGYGAGRAMTTPVDTTAIRRQIESDLRVSLETTLRERLLTEVKKQIATELAATRAQQREELERYRARMRRDAVQWQRRTVAASNEETARLLERFAQAYRAARAEDRRALVSLLGVLESRRVSDYSVLRSNLETLAAVTGDELQRTQEGIVRLVAYVQPFGIAPRPSEGMPPTEEGSKE